MKCNAALFYGHCSMKDMLVLWKDKFMVWFSK